MIRISTIFVGVCMALVAGSLGMVLYAMAGVTGYEAAIVALAALTVMILYSAVSLRMRDRSKASMQVDDLSRGTAELARQVAEFGRRLAAVETRTTSSQSANQDRIHEMAGEIGELGTLVKQLATSVATHEDLLTTRPASASPSVVQAPAQIGPRLDVPATATVTALPATAQRDGAQWAATVASAVAENRIDIYLQPVVTLPQRKVRFYEAMTRLRDDKDHVIVADDFIGAAESAGLMDKIDHVVMLRCMQVLRRLMVRNKDVGVFCNVAAATLSNAETFAQCIDFLDANRALAASFVLEFKQSTFRSLGPIESEHLAALAQRGYRFSIDHVTDLRVEPRDLADRGVRFIKVPAALLLDPNKTAGSDIHAADLSDLLGRFGIDLIAERIEGERAVVDLLDFDVRFGQGFLFAAPRPLRPEAPSGGAPSTPPEPAANPAELSAAAKPAPQEVPKGEPPRTGMAALARRATGSN